MAAISFNQISSGPAHPCLAEIHEALRVPSPIPSSDWDCSDYDPSLVSNSRHATLNTRRFSPLSSSGLLDTPSIHSTGSSSCFPFDCASLHANETSSNDHSLVTPSESIAEQSSQASIHETTPIVQSPVERDDNTSMNEVSLNAVSTENRSEADVLRVYNAESADGQASHESVTDTASISAENKIAHSSSIQDRIGTYVDDADDDSSYSDSTVDGAALPTQHPNSSIEEDPLSMNMKTTSPVDVSGELHSDADTVSNVSPMTSDIDSRLSFVQHNNGSGSVLETASIIHEHSTLEIGESSFEFSDSANSEGLVDDDDENNTIRSFGMSDDSFSSDEVKTPPRYSMENDVARPEVYSENYANEPGLNAVPTSVEPNPYDANTPHLLLPKVTHLPDPRFTDVLSALNSFNRGYLMRQCSKVVHATSGGIERSHVVESALPSQNNESVTPKTLRPTTSRTAASTSGRLLVKLIELKNLTLPLAAGHDTMFMCYQNGEEETRKWKVLRSHTAIQREYSFDQVSGSVLTWTLRAKYERPAPKPRPRSTLGKVFSSSRRKTVILDPVSQALNGHVSPEGVFGTVTLNLDTIRNTALGRCQVLRLPIMNKWTVNTTNPDAKPTSHKVGEMEVHVFYIPALPVPPKDLPTTISAALQDLRMAEWDRTLLCDGYLSQQGGDCPYWRRRYFQLIGSKLVAFHQFSKARRATIDLSVATHIVDDNHYSDEDELEGYLFLETGFRIIFSDGEHVDFYAETVDEKEQWMATLRKHLGQCSKVSKSWTKAFLTTVAQS
ncbi:medial ring protein Mid2 [Schizosaccharomyces japonicus yFS275]|uniref:Medial ring protein Mid2 n=1 Tax=Schizosaccharomyces japonicus (strain yFS275 / FY16936) TaxID=402676 RepID=B6JXH9_SCHJY|nr:medial ring protein Mid2 [Schizosaccharomyces japonicus yFS275]EEB05123.2 medial ring protein Mid2 [Schizosaccharomyces japonicus yFS275]